jgi:hypothetical protein
VYILLNCIFIKGLGFCVLCIWYDSFNNDVLNLSETERNHFSLKFKRMEVVVQEGFLFQYCELGCGDHPQEDLAKFDDGLERTLEKFRISAMFWQHLGTYCLNMAI